MLTDYQKHGFVELHVAALTPSSRLKTTIGGTKQQVKIKMFVGRKMMNKNRKKKKLTL